MRTGVVFHRLRPVQPRQSVVDGLSVKIIFGSTPTWLRAPLTSCRFKAPHYTCTNRQTV